MILSSISQNRFQPPNYGAINQTSNLSADLTQSASDTTIEGLPPSINNPNTAFSNYAERTRLVDLEIASQFSENEQLPLYVAEPQPPRYRQYEASDGRWITKAVCSASFLITAAGVIYGLATSSDLVLQLCFVPAYICMASFLVLMGCTNNNSHYVRWS